MNVVNLRDAIILNILKNGYKSRSEIEAGLGLAGKATMKSLSMLRDSGLIARQSAQGKDSYFLTDSGKNAIEKIFIKMATR